VLGLRLRALRRRHALTEALAAGADPCGSEELALVAGRLIRPRTRRHLAEGIDRVLRLATGPPRPASPAVPLNRCAVMGVREQLATLAERLRDPAPIPVQTVALAAALLRDGTGPLYGGGGRAPTGGGPLLRRLAAQPRNAGGRELRFQR
jgi:hypothetical protein